MLNRLESLTQRVGGSNELIDQWLHARKELLVSYCTVIGIKPQKGKHTPLNEKALENFCHNLVDYLSSGHFHIYDRIIKQVEGASSPKMALTTKVYPALKITPKLSWHSMIVIQTLRSMTIAAPSFNMLYPISVKRLMLVFGSKINLFNGRLNPGKPLSPQIKRVRPINLIN